MPCDLQQVVIVTDKRVEPDALICAGDLQRRGGVRCSLDPALNVPSKMNQATCDLLKEDLLTDKAEHFVHQVFETCKESIKSDPPARPGCHRVVFVQTYPDPSDSAWTCPSLCHPSVRPHKSQRPSWKSDRESRKTPESAPESQRILISHSSESQALSGATDAAGNTYMTQKQKSTQTDGRTGGLNKSKVFSGRTKTRAVPDF